MIPRRQILGWRFSSRKFTGECCWQQLWGRNKCRIGHGKVKLQRSWNRGLSWSLGELWSWDGPSKLFQVKAKGQVLWCLHQPVIGWGLPSRREYDLGLGAAFDNYWGRDSAVSCQKATLLVTVGKRSWPWRGASGLHAIVFTTEVNLSVPFNSLASAKHVRETTLYRPGAIQPTTWPHTSVSPAEINQTSPDQKNTLGDSQNLER